MVPPIPYRYEIPTNIFFTILPKIEKPNPTESPIFSPVQAKKSKPAPLNLNPLF
jgi:hypothetical protein